MRFDDAVSPNDPSAVCLSNAILPLIVARPLTVTANWSEVDEMTFVKSLLIRSLRLSRIEVSRLLIGIAMLRPLSLLVVFGAMVTVAYLAEEDESQCAYCP